MKQAVTFVVFMLVVFLLPGQSWQWVRTAGGGNIMPDLAHGGLHVITNGAGDVICEGTYTGNFSFGDTIACSGTGLFWGKYDALGNRKNFVFGGIGGGQYASAGIFGDKQGRYFAAGGVTGSGFMIDTVFAASDGFWVRFNEENRPVWSHNLNAAPNGRHGSIHSLDFDDSGNIYMTGVFDGVDTYLDTAVMHNQEGSLKYKFFVARFDTAAHLQWVRQCYGGNNYIGRCFWRNSRLYTLVSVSDSCSTYDTLTFCPGNYAGNSFASVMALEPGSGKVIWHREQLAYGPMGSYSYADLLGNTYYAGAFDSVVFFDTITLTRLGLHDGYVVKYDSLGNVSWAQQFYSSLLLNIYDMYTDPTGNTCIAGSFRGDLHWNGNVFHNNGYETMFVTRYNTDGKYLGTVVVTDAVARGVTQDASGNIIVTGHTTAASATTMFGDLPVESSGNQRFFIGKLDNITGLSFKTEEDEKLKIYANPNNGQFTIQLPEGTVHEKQLELQISSMSGMEVYSGIVQLSNNQVRVGLGVIGKGTYSVSLHSTYKRYTGLVVVQ